MNELKRVDRGTGRYVEVMETVWIASDGKEFTDYGDCVKYERYLEHKDALDALDKYSVKADRGFYLSLEDGLADRYDDVDYFFVRFNSRTQWLEFKEAFESLDLVASEGWDYHDTEPDEYPFFGVIVSQDGGFSWLSSVKYIKMRMSQALAKIDEYDELLKNKV